MSGFGTRSRWGVNLDVVAAPLGSEYKFSLVAVARHKEHVISSIYVRAADVESSGHLTSDGVDRTIATLLAGLPT